MLTASKLRLTPETVQTFYVADVWSFLLTGSCNKAKFECMQEDTLLRPFYIASGLLAGGAMMCQHA